MPDPASIEQLLNPQGIHKPRAEVRIGLIGASVQPKKFGWIILQDLLRKGFDVVPINPRLTEIEGRACFPTPSAVPGGLDILNFVVPPQIALSMLPTIDPARFDTVWFQPGAFDRQVVEAAKARFTRVLAGPCIMVEARAP